MANVLVGHRAVAARQLAVGVAVAIPVQTGDLLQIVDLWGKQVASLVAIAGPGEHLSTPVTASMNASLVLKTGDKLYSQRATPLFELIEDSMGRHDLLTVPLPIEADTQSTVKAKVSTRDALEAAAADVGLESADVTNPVNFFKHVVIKQKGEIEVRESLAERNDTVILRVLADCTVIVANAFHEKKPGLAAAQPAAGNPGQVLVRVYR